MSLNPRIVDTDSDGTPFVGTIHNNAWLQALLDLIDGRWSRVTITSTGTQNNLSIDDSGGHDADLVIFNNATDLTITGIVAPSSPSKPGKPLRYICTGAGNVFFKHQNAGSAAANRMINIATSGDTPHAGGSGKGTAVYDDSASRWTLLHHEQGAFIDYSATSTFTGYSAFTTKILSYCLRGRQLHVVATINGTSNATGNSVTLPFTSLSGPTVSMAFEGVDNGTVVSTACMAQIASASSTLGFFKDWTGAAWTASGTKEVFGSFLIGVQ
jgi:hypothetical protein